MKFTHRATEKTIAIGKKKATIFHIPSLEKMGFGNVWRLPYSTKVLLENVLRNYDACRITVDDIKKLIGSSVGTHQGSEIAFKPGRVLLQDFTGVPCVVDLAALRAAIKRMGGDYRKINPQVPCDLIIDHSVQTDFYGTKSSLAKNIAREFMRNRERYEFLKWGQGAFKNLRVIPPATGIIHQINLEYLAKGLLATKSGGKTVIYPDSVIGTDSHTTMINGLGIVGWGVGGIEAEAVMLGEPIYMLVPQVIGFCLTGMLKDGVTATDAVLTITEILRAKNVVGKFVEFYGDGMHSLTLPDRATIANMAPEYGATMGFFPTDDETLRYYKMTGRSKNDIDMLERYLKEQGMFCNPDAPVPHFSDTLKLDLSSVVSCAAGPKRPQDRVQIRDMKKKFHQILTVPISQRGYGIKKTEQKKTVTIKNRSKEKIGHGAVVIASIDSCTNTSNPSLLIGAGLLARNAVKRGLKVKGYVKTSLAPGSRVATEYLKKSGLLLYLEKLGFYVAGYGCMTCIGNSGPLAPKVGDAIQQGGLIAASISSGNRNFEGRINPLTRANYLTSPSLVVAYALAGTMDIDLSNEPIGKDAKGKNVFLDDIWPHQQDIDTISKKVVTGDKFRSGYKNVTKGSEQWRLISAKKSPLYAWKNNSTYIQEPPFFVDMKENVGDIEDISKARALVMVGDSITTDHISPAGVISSDSPAGIYLKECGVKPVDFNTYGSRRGNDKVMVRGTFANIRLRNLIAPGTEGSQTIYFPTKKQMSIYEAAMLYQRDHSPLVVIAGREYGTGSSRDWAAKGTALLGVRVVLAQSFERIHRSNLVGMGVLPLEFKPGDSREALGITGDEVFDFRGLAEGIKPKQEISVVAHSGNGSVKIFKAICRLDTQVEIDYYRNGGILQTVLRKLLKATKSK